MTKISLYRPARAGKMYTSANGMTDKTKWRCQYEVWVSEIDLSCCGVYCNVM